MDSFLFDLLQKNYRNKLVMVTGGAGFIGSNLCYKLLDLGAFVVAIDDLSTGKITNLDLAHPRLFFEKISINNSLFFSKDLNHFLDYSVIFHLAAVSSVPLANQHPALCLETNQFALENVLRSISSFKKKPVFVFSSSASVYGEIEAEAFESDFCNPVSIYAKSKFFGELLCKQYSEAFGLNCFALRYFNVFGKNQPQANAISCFSKALLEGQTIKVFGDGLQVRDFVSVEQVVLANLVMPISELRGFNVFNVGSGKPISILQLIDNLANELGIKCFDLEFLPPRDGDVATSVGNFSKYNGLINDIKKRCLNILVH